MQAATNGLYSVRIFSSDGYFVFFLSFPSSSLQAFVCVTMSSQVTEPQHSQASLAPPVEFNIPTDPVRRTSLSASPELNVKSGSHTSQSEKSKLLSPPPLSSSDMTPPPSTQVPGAPLRRSRSRSNSLAGPPPDLEKTLRAAYGASENLPTGEEIDKASEHQLRSIAKDLLAVAQESRMSSLHFKLQNSLLSFSSNEAIKRAEVEQQLARREVEILQSSEYRNRQGPAEIKPLQPISNAELELALRRNQELERSHDALDRRLRRAKRLIEQEKVKSDLLNEENGRLKGRIFENRQHFSLMIENGNMASSPHAESQTPRRGTGRHFSGNNHGNQHVGREENDGFATLLAAGRVLSNRDSASDASTPDQHHVSSQYSNGDMYGSSYPRTPARSQAVDQSRQYYTPMANGRDEQRFDRDSTISASDAEEAETEAEEPVPNSQASALATSMLRHNRGSTRRQNQGATSAPKSSTLLQTKLFGQVKKPGAERSSGLKRKASLGEKNMSSKRSRAPANVGLGIETWDDNTRRA